MWIWAVSAAQHGAISHEQLVAGGVSTTTISRWAEEGLLARVQPRAYVVSGSPDTFHRRCWAALLAAGDPAALSHRTAAWLWDLSRDPHEPIIELVVPRGRTPDLYDVLVHQTRDAFAIHRHRSLLVTSPLRTIVDLGAVTRDGIVYDAVDLGRVASLFSIAALEWQLVEVARHGRRGVGALRRVLDAWALGSQRPEGILEPRFARMRVRFGLPEAEFQHPVGPYRIDFAYPALMIAIEIDGYEAHAGRRAFQADRERQNYLVGLGWTVLRFTWTDIVKRPEMVARAIAAEIGRAESRIRD